MEEKNIQNHDVAEVAQSNWLEFERNFDLGLFETMARNHTPGRPLPAGWRFLGEGADQVALGRTCGQIDYSLSIPKPSFLDRSGDEGRKWLEALVALRREARRRLFEPLLIPPMQISTKPAAIIMPVGRVIGVVPLEQLDQNRVASTMALLDYLNLELDDRLQIAEWRGQTFIYDWSDLRAKRPQPFISANRRSIFGSQSS